MSKTRRCIIYTGVAFILIISSMTSFLAACSANSNQEAALTESPKPPDVDSKNGPSWTLDTTPVKLDWYINFNWYSKKWDVQNCLFDREVTERTGVEINIIVPAGSGNEKLNAMIASGELPDIITVDNWTAIREQKMVKTGIFSPLNELASRYAPELLEYIPESIIRWYTEDDGNWYAVPNFFNTPEQLAEDPFIENNNGIIARKDIMLHLGIKPEDFSTQEGAIKALTKVRDAGIVFNGQKVEPLRIQFHDWVMARMWGIPWETPEGNWQDIKTHPKYLEIYKFLNRLWLNGLISKDNFTVWAGEKISQGLVFSYIGNIDDVMEVIQDAFKKDNRCEFVPVGPIHALDGAQPIFDQAGTGWTSTFITRKSRNPDRAVRLLAFLASDEGQMLSWFGVEGKTYNLVDGKVHYTEEYSRLKDKNIAEAQRIYGLEVFWPLLQHQFKRKFEDISLLSPVDKMVHNIKTYMSRFAHNETTPETMGIIPDQGTAEAGIADKIEEYWVKVTTRMIIAKSESEVERIYNEALDYINECGYQKVYDACNAKFLALKKKAGKQYSYPWKK